MKPEIICHILFVMLFIYVVHCPLTNLNTVVITMEKLSLSYKWMWHLKNVIGNTDHMAAHYKFLGHENVRKQQNLWNGRTHATIASFVVRSPMRFLSIHSLNNINATIVRRLRLSGRGTSRNHYTPHNSNVIAEILR